MKAGCRQATIEGRLALSGAVAAQEKQSSRTRCGRVANGSADHPEPRRCHGDDAGSQGKAERREFYPVADSASRPTTQAGSNESPFQIRSQFVQFLVLILVQNA